MDYEKRIRELLSKMTIEEKAGQLQQCGPSLVGAFDVDFEELLNMMFDKRISEDEFNRIMSSAGNDYHLEELRAGKIGSYMGIKSAETANMLQKIAVEETRLGIPLLFGADVIHGYKTVTPIPLAESCAWEPELWERTGRMAAREATAGGVHMTFAPMMDVAKDARWGRISEGAGEDVLLVGTYGVAKVKGFQGDDTTKEDSMFACVKHFAGYGAVEAGRDYNRVDMSMQRFHEEYLPGYEAAVKAGARAVMPAFNDINGVPCSVNKWLLTDVLRNKWGFNGMTVSDSNAIDECVNHGIAIDRADAAAKALEAGMDMDMSSNCYAENLVRLVNEGKVAMADLDRAAANVLRLKFEKGLFENPYQTSEERECEAYLKPEYRQLARESAVKSIVLLKNDDMLLPLDKKIKLGVIGEYADNASEMLGSWAAEGRGEDAVSLVKGLENAGAEFELYADTEAVIASDCDVVLVTIGESKNQSGEASSRADISLPWEQTAMLQEVQNSGKKVVAVMFNGRPVALGDTTKFMNAFIEAWHLGVEAGNAICDVLFGEVNPSGKLTTTFPYASGQCPMYYAHINTGRPGGKFKFTSKYLDTPMEPVYPFGYGLSYTSYEYSDLHVQADVEKEMLLATVTVKNTGKYHGDEVVQCYVRDKVGVRVRPVKQLVDFIKITLNAGESQAVTFQIPFEKLGYYDNDMQFVTESGEFEIFAGGNSSQCLSECVYLKF